MPDIIVVDDFYENPVLVRNFALKSEWLRANSLQADFPGTESRKCFFSASLVTRLAELVGKGINIDPARNSFGAFALTLEMDNDKKIIHLDGCKWAGVLFLTPDAYASGGTNLYRHKRTGLCRYPTQADAEEHGFQSADIFCREIIKESSHTSADWELDVSVEMRFNRLVLFKGGERFHAPDHYFGTTPENGRLVQLFFFDETTGGL